ncbi:SH3 domain-containing protein [Microbacterium elymi]|uniref:SH3 domain-containing protein n=1 Tax=Microbacterium elymi TaxID=2909587 RepID=A0ABY5NL09_9MICO|nr:SH3 domain-containing protein [Microbacterium elymi]UUT35756.1 SH3 domain-containing protein [Microbacterium elymi]
MLKKSGSWSQVRYGSRTGWVANAYLTSTSSSASKPAASASKTQTTVAALNLRTSGSMSAKIVTVLPRGAKVTILKKSGSWSQVKYGSKTGWVSNRYLR